MLPLIETGGYSKRARGSPGAYRHPPLPNWGSLCAFPPLSRGPRRDRHAQAQKTPRPPRSGSSAGVV